MKTSKEQQEIENKKFQFWKRWSSTPHTEDELEEMLRKAPDAVCISFICRHSQLSGEFIEKNMSPSGNDCCADEIEIYSDKKTFITRDGISKARMGSSTGNIELGRYSYETAGLVDRLDWYYISMFQKLSEDFIRKYIFRLDLRQILGYQKIPLGLRLEIQQVFTDTKKESVKTQIKQDIQYKVI